LLTCALACWTQAAEEPAMEPMFVINEDNSHFFGSRGPEDMTLAGLHAFVDGYAGTTVTHLFLCPNAMRASFRSGTRDAIWDPVNGREPTQRWPSHARLLHERGLDPYAVWIGRCRERGISPWLSMRMNDIHSVDEPDNFMHSTFWREHPECRRVPNGSASPWQNRALNYAHAEVREHQIAFLRELFERYDPDGIELDWMRFGYHLTPGREGEEGEILTAFVREAHALAATWSQRRGHPVRLGCRVPAHPDAASGLGMDGVTWAREGWVDMLVPCPFWSSSDFDIPVELWRERLGEAATRVVVAPGIEHNSRPWPAAVPVANDLPLLRGFAASARHRGARSLYLFNWMDSGTRPVSSASYRKLLDEGLGREVVLTSPRRHPVCYRDTVPPGFPNEIRLPVDAANGGEWTLVTGPRPTAGQVELIAGLAKLEGVKTARFAAVLNGNALTEHTDVYPLTEFGGAPGRAIRFDCPLDTLREGTNTVAVRQIDGNDPSQRIVWVEVRIAPKQAP
ncbi:MAG: hypothetical protein JXR77_06465, partial [Lentisphaeria bacterium]|nr:hypothetical protein [Lentisphaeria bacterium]